MLGGVCKICIHCFDRLGFLGDWQQAVDALFQHIKHHILDFVLVDRLPDPFHGFPKEFDV